MSRHIVTNRIPVQGVGTWVLGWFLDTHLTHGYLRQLPTSRASISCTETSFIPGALVNACHSCTSIVDEAALCAYIDKHGGLPFFTIRIALLSQT